jgi:hypothetical protein
MVIGCEIGFFTKLQRSFEWKIYSHDEPPDLRERLRSRGFKIGEEEALMILDLEEVPPPLLAPAPTGVTVRSIADEQGIADFLTVEGAIWDHQSTTQEFLLSMLSDPLQRDLAFVAYFAQKTDRNRAWRLHCKATLPAFGEEAFSRNFAGMEFIGRCWQHGFNMPGDWIQFATCVSMPCLAAVQFWRNTDSGKWHPPGLRIGLR